MSRVISSGTRRSSSRSSTGQASAAERSAMAAWVRARSPKPWPASGPDSAHSSEASARWAALSTAWTCSTRRTAPATSSSSSASIRNEIDTSCGRSSRPRGRIRAIALLELVAERRRGSRGSRRRRPTGRGGRAARAARGRARHRVDDRVEQSADHPLGGGLVEAVAGPRARQVGDPALVGGVEPGDLPVPTLGVGREAARRRPAAGPSAPRPRAARPTGAGRPGRGPCRAPAARRGSASRWCGARR